MTIKNIFGRTIEVTHLPKAIKETKLFVTMSEQVKKDKDAPIKFISEGNNQVTLLEYHNHNLIQLQKLK